MHHLEKLFCFSSYSIEGGIIGAMFLAGLIGGLTHCSVMCSPFTFALSAQKLSDKSSQKFSEAKRFFSSLLIPYHLGRIITYSVLGAISGWISTKLIAGDYFNYLRFFLLAIALMFFVFASIGSVPVNYFRFPFVSKYVEKFSARLYGNDTKINSFYLGLILGFLPCAMVYGALIVAVATGSVAVGAIAVAAFGFGTMIPLILTNYGFGFFVKKYKLNLRKISPVLYAVNSAILIFIIINHIHN